ncbi:hypothetical protein GGI12_004267 [Dipsacomyces acuminosporus]|nr:hypothetical protein GGI12_004267 [Dipsacomyces acuminosporus]
MADSSDTVDDIHGFFQFANVSDSEDEDGLFGKTRDRTVAFDASKINYTPKVDEDQWFDQEEQLGFKDWFHTHAGLDEITFTVQRLYFKREYPRVLDLCEKTTKEYVEKNKRSLRVANIREILEIGANAAMQLDDCESVRFFYSWYQQCGATYPGFNSFQASVLTKLGRFDEALDQYVKYLRQRKQDAKIWELIGLLLVKVSQEAAESTLKLIWLRLALGSFYHSHSIIYDCKNWKDIDFAIRRRQLQVKELYGYATDALEAIGSDIKLEGANADDMSFWEQCLGEVAHCEEAAPALLNSIGGTLKESVSWIVAQLFKGGAGEADGSGDDDDSSENNVADL